jgi:hypothetical protein
MSPILGSKGSLSASAYGFTSSAVALGSYDSISTATVTSGGTADITFSSIPQTYTHLQLRGLLQGANSGSTNDVWKITFNTDTATNYSYHEVYGNGTSAATVAGSTVAFMNSYGVPSSGFTSIFAGTVIDILDYTNTNKYKTLKALTGYNSNASTDSIDFASGNWRSLSAITSITISPISGSWAQYSQISLYGIK